MRLKLISELLRAFDDPDWKFIADLEEGGAIGVGGGYAPHPRGVRGERKMELGRTRRKRIERLGKLRDGRGPQNGC